MAHNKPKQNAPHHAPHSAIHALHSSAFRLFIIVFLIVLTLYTLTLAPGVVGGDAGEHQFAVPLLGIPHTTGYPLYVLLGKLWTLLLPIGSPAWRMNLFSAVGGAMAAAITSLVVYYLSLPAPHAPRPATIHWSGGFVAGLSLACGLTLWQWSTIAGVRSINVLFFALLTLEAIIWQRQRQQGETQTAERTLRWLALTVGLSLAHHRTTIFYLPSLVGWVWWHDRKLILQPKRLLTLLLLSLAPLNLYAFIYLRGINNPPYTHEIITDFESFWFLVGSGDSSGLFFSIDPTFLPARLAFIWHDLLAQLSWPGVLLAGLGGLLLLGQQTRHFFFQGLLVLLLLLFTLDFEVVNLNEAPAWYLMPAYFILTVWLGVAVSRFTFTCTPGTARQGKCAFRRKCHVSRITQHAQHLTTLLQLVTPAVVTVMLAYTLAWPNWQQIYTDSTAPLDEWRQLLRGRQAERFVQSSLPEVEANSIIWGDWEQYTPLKYYQLINGLRTDVTVRNPLNRWPEKVAAARAAGQEIYFTRKTIDLIGTPYLSMAGSLIHLQTGPQFDVPVDITLLDANFEDELELIGYRAEVLPQHTLGGKQAGDILQLRFYWRVPHRVAWDYALSLRLIDENGQEVYKRDATHPVLSSYPTTLWSPGEVVGDFYELPLPPGSDSLTLRLLPYRSEEPGQWHNLTLNDTEPLQEGILLGPFRR